MSKIIVSGSIAYDRIMSFPGLFSEHIMADKLHAISVSFLIDKVSVDFGGTAGNIAYNLALLGEHAEIIATVGKDFADFRAHMLLSGVDPKTIRVVEDDTTASAWIFTDSANSQIAAFHFGAGGRAYDTPVETEGRALAIIAPGCLDDMIALPALYRRQNMHYLFDPGQTTTALSDEALKNGISSAYVLLVNDYELGLIAQKTGWAEQMILEHVPTLVVTYGSEGSRVITREGQWQVPAAKLDRAVDPTGAGDAYRAGFAKGMIAGFTYEDCAKLGSIVASFVVENHGTQTHKFTTEQLKERYKQTYNRDLKL